MSALDQQPAPRLGERTPLDWRELLDAQLVLQAQQTDFYDAYYNGDHRLQFTTSKFREAFGNLFGAFADNWCQIVVDAAVERLKVVGFHVDGKESDEAWALWQANGLDGESVVAHTEASKSGRAFLLVDPNEGEPRITVEHSSQVVVATDPGDHRHRLAALKRWRGDDDYVYLTLYLPDVVLRFQSNGPEEGHREIEWVPRDDEAPEVPNPLGVVPVIPLENKPSLVGPPDARWQRVHSDLEPAVPLQDAVNKLCSDMIVASEYGAFPQRVVTGWEVPRDPETGDPLWPREELRAAMSRLWTFGKPDVRATSLPAADLANFVVAINLFIQHLAAQTRTPPHYLLGQVVNASGDALSVAEAGLVSKCRTKILFFSDPWEEALALALTAAGRETTAADCEVVWANPERQTQAQLTDAATKKKALGVPLPVIWLELGYTPQQIADMEAEQEPPAPPPASPALDAAVAAAAAAASPAIEPPTAPQGGIGTDG